MHKIYSYYSEEILIMFSIDKDAFLDFPLWLETEDYPPLPPREAIDISKRTILEILRQYPWAEPEFMSCALKQLSKCEGSWYYDIDWVVWPPEENGSDRCAMNVPVMLNGEVPPFEIFKYEDRINAWQT